MPFSGNVVQVFTFLVLLAISTIVADVCYLLVKNLLIAAESSSDNASAMSRRRFIFCEDKA